MSEKSCTFGTPLFASEQGILRKYVLISHKMLERLLRVLPDISKGGIFLQAWRLACLVRMNIVLCKHSRYLSVLNR